MKNINDYIVDEVKKSLKNVDEEIIKGMAKHIHEYLEHANQHWAAGNDVEEIEKAIRDYISTYSRR